jgi:hypothetical protein
VKREVISFTLKSVKPRDPMAKELLDRDGPYRARRVDPKTAYQRKPKHRSKFFQDRAE